MSRSSQFGLFRFTTFCAVTSSLIVAACAGSDVPLRGEGGAGPTGSASAPSSGGASGSAGSGNQSEGGSDNEAGSAGSDDPGNDDPGNEGGEGGSEAPGGSDCDGAQILATSCGAGGCHGSPTGFSAFGDDPESFIDTASPLYGTCGVLIDPASPTDSLIYKKATGTQDGACGGSMPPGSTLSDDDAACLQEYIGSL